MTNNLGLRLSRIYKDFSVALPSAMFFPLSRPATNSKVLWKSDPVEKTYTARVGIGHLACGNQAPPRGKPHIHYRTTSCLFQPGIIEQANAPKWPQKTKSGH
jgi:hypothetical protein